MKLNWLGRASMNKALRAWGQRYSASWLEQLGGRIEGGRALEVGCGRGVGVEIIFGRFKAASVDAFDLDPKMIECARRYLASRGLDGVQLSIGDATRIKAPDATFDAVFDFGAIHLVPDWPRAIAEVRRVLKPGGKFYFEWVTGRLARLPYPLLTDGFGTMEPPSRQRLVEELKWQGIILGQNFVCPRMAAISGVIGDFTGVGVVPNGSAGPD